MNLSSPSLTPTAYPYPLEWLIDTILCSCVRLIIAVCVMYMSRGWMLWQKRHYSDNQNHHHHPQATKILETTQSAPSPAPDAVPHHSIKDNILNQPHLSLTSMLQHQSQALLNQFLSDLTPNAAVDRSHHSRTSDAATGTATATAATGANRFSHHELDFLRAFPIASEPTTFNRMIELFQHHGTNNHTTRNHNQVGAIVHPAAIFTQFYGMISNNIVSAYEGSPLAHEMEHAVLSWLMKSTGWEQELAGAISVPSGTYANAEAMYLALNAWKRRTFHENHHHRQNSPNPDSLHLRDTCPSRLAVFTSEVSHYSIDRAADKLQIPRRNVFKVRVDPSTQRMSSVALRLTMNEAIERGLEPFFINATLGTTVVGAIDDMDEIDQVVKELPREVRRPWIHADAAHGGLWVLFLSSSMHLARLRHADSLTLDAHKYGWCLNALSFLLVRERVVLDAYLPPTSSKYLFHDETSSLARRSSTQVMDLTETIITTNNINTENITNIDVNIGTNPYHPESSLWSPRWHTSSMEVRADSAPPTPTPSSSSSSSSSSSHDQILPSLGVRSPYCTKPFNISGVFFLFRYLGIEGIQAHAKLSHQLVCQFITTIQNRSRALFQIPIIPQTSMCCFRIDFAHLVPFPFPTDSQNVLMREFREYLHRDGVWLFNEVEIENIRYLRVNFVNPNHTEGTMNEVVDKLCNDAETFLEMKKMRVRDVHAHLHRQLQVQDSKAP